MMVTENSLIIMPSSMLQRIQQEDLQKAVENTSLLSPFLCAFVAQGLEHWSRKPGVESSILSEGIARRRGQ
ncbi:unnamed protein product [Rodentolepis nana]|uniref:Uncharacterized protein n=1 Tax=Rodentolepis nana TaxID=102285 RepID=A0A0R3TB51_RODNA|nr:unnamed protein product [Rodentolepis nana]